MKKSRLTKILVEGNPMLINKMTAEVVRDYEITLEKKPALGLVMVKARDSVSLQPFYVGEMLVTECTVSLNGIFGIGVIKGEEWERSYQLAVIDAAFNAKLPLIDSWFPLLLEEEESINERYRKESAMVAQTQVQFDTMEDYNDKS